MSTTITDVAIDNPNEETFVHDTLPHVILEGATFRIEEGKTVAIVGSSGCGKSTILRLLFRFYDANITTGSSSSTITIGGIPIQELYIEFLRRSITVIPQHAVLFNETDGYNMESPGNG
jgi:ATP-binding cassette, subfamily B (MDR/TAP), member 7